MPLLFIHLRNSDYCARDEGAEFDHPEAALRMGVQGALGLAADEIGRGSCSVAVEVSIEQEDGTCLLTSVVAVSVCALMALKADLHEGP